MATAIEDDETETIAAKSLESTWNVPGLKKEVGRLVMRSHKKVAKANTRLTNALETVDKLTSDPDVTMEQLEQCPSIDAIEFELQQIQERLQKLNELEEQLQSISKKKVVLPESIAGLALELGVNDEPPPRQPRGPTKKKGPRNKVSTRLPYRRYYTANKTEIRVSVGRVCTSECCHLVVVAEASKNFCLRFRLERRRRTTISSPARQSIEMDRIGGCMQLAALAVTW